MMFLGFERKVNHYSSCYHLIIVVWYYFIMSHLLTLGFTVEFPIGMPFPNLKYVQPNVAQERAAI